MSYGFSQCFRHILFESAIDVNIYTYYDVVLSDYLIVLSSDDPEERQGGREVDGCWSSDDCGQAGRRDSWSHPLRLLH